MAKSIIEEKIVIPDGVDLSTGNALIKVKGPKGENQRKLFSQLVKIERDGKNLILRTSRKTKKEKRILYTIKSHIQNLINGTLNEYTYELKILSSHFPMNVSISNDTLIIKNFLGEKIPRKAKILPGADVKIEGDLIKIKGTNIEAAGQTASNIEQACRITNRDRRIFNDGIWIIKKSKKFK